MKMLKVVSHLDNVIDKHFDMIYTPANNEVNINGESVFTPSICKVELQHTTRDGIIKRSGAISITGKMSKIIYSAFLGWREERKQHVLKTTLDMNELYEDLLIKHGSYREVEVRDDETVRSHLYTFIPIDARCQFVDECGGGEVKTIGEIAYIVDKIDLFKPSVYLDMDNIPMQTEESISISEDDWWDYHLGIKSIDDDWCKLRESNGITPEQKDEIFEKLCQTLGVETDC